MGELTIKERALIAIPERNYGTLWHDARLRVIDQIREAEQAAAEKARTEEREACIQAMKNARDPDTWANTFSAGFACAEQAVQRRARSKRND